MITDLKNKIRIIGYDDDNHGVRIFVNGKYIDDMDNRLTAAVHIFQAGQNLPEGEIVEADVYICDIEEDDETLDKVHMLLCYAEELTEEQELAILNQDYQKLISL